VIRRLEMAIAIDAHRSFHRAARALGISQPSLTRALQVLETEIGARLFERGKTECVPTTFGRVVLTRARRILSEVAESKREVALLQGLQIGEFSIGCGSASIQQALGGAVGDLCASNPALKVRTVELPWYQLPDALMSAEIDVAMGEPSDLAGNPEIVVSRLPRRTVRLVCRLGHPLAGASHVSMEDMMRFPFVGPRLPRRIGMYFPANSALGEMSADSRYFTPTILCTGWNAIREIVLRSDALAVRPLAVLQAPENSGDLVILPYDGPWLFTEFAVMWRRDRMVHPAIKVFRDAVRRNEAAVLGGKSAPSAVA
jgi:DNA-binding transcriptional LysR family regulator